MHVYVCVCVDIHTDIHISFSFLHFQNIFLLCSNILGYDHIIIQLIVNEKFSCSVHYLAHSINSLQMYFHFTRLNWSFIWALDTQCCFWRFQPNWLGCLLYAMLVALTVFKIFYFCPEFFLKRKRKSKFSMFLFIPSYPSNTLVFLTESHKHKMNELIYQVL